MEFNRKATFVSSLIFINMVLSGIFLVLDQWIGLCITSVLFILLFYLKFKAGPSYISRNEESLSFKYMSWKQKHYLLSVFLMGQVIYIVFLLMIVLTNKFQIFAFCAFTILFYFAVLLGLLLRKQYFKSNSDNEGENPVGPLITALRREKSRKG